MGFITNATTEVDINGTAPGSGHDQLRVLSSASLFGSLRVSNTISPPPGTVLTILDNQGASAVSGIFTGLPEGASITNGGTVFRISYLGGSGNDVTLTVPSLALPSLITNIVVVTNNLHITGLGVASASYILEA